MYYQNNGLMVEDESEISACFFIQENMKCNLFDSRYWYEGDSVNYELDNACVNLYDVFENKILRNIVDQEDYIYCMPQGIIRGGLDSDCNISKECFQRYFEEELVNLFPKELRTSEIETIYKKIDEYKYMHAYLADCHALINTVQELLQTCSSNFVYFYKLLCLHEAKTDFCDDYYAVSVESRMAISAASNIFITLYSIFDVITKIAYELENIRESKGVYPKLASKKILYGDAKKLKTIDINGTIFEKSKNVSIIENLRNELVHNATWEMNSKVFVKVEAGKVIEKCIYMPDFSEEGYLITYKNRKRFFSDGVKLNEQLPNIYFEILHRILNTIEKLR